MPYALCPMPYALCPMPYALCRIVPHLSEKGYTCIYLYYTKLMENTVKYEKVFQYYIKSSLHRNSKFTVDC